MRIHHNTLKKAKSFKIELRVEDDKYVVAYSKDGARLAAGLQGNKVLEDAIVALTGKVAKRARDATLASAPKPSKAKRTRAVEVEEDEETGDESAVDADAGDEEVEEDTRHDIVKPKYREKYKPFGGRCGDDLAEQITEHVTVETDDGPKTGKAELKRFAEANGAWKPAYASLTTKSGAWNAGLARMNVSNIIRGKVRQAVKAGEKFKIDWA